MPNVKPPAEQLALASVRVVIAAIFLWHGVPKAFDPAGAVDKFIGFGLPGILGPITGGVELVAGVLLLAGLFTRPAVLTLGVIILGALATVQIPGGVTPGLERDLLVLAGLAVLFTGGGGTMTLDALRSRDTTLPSTDGDPTRNTLDGRKFAAGGGALSGRS